MLYLTGLVANKVVLTLQQEFGVCVEEVSGLLTAVTAEVSYDEYKHSRLICVFERKHSRS